MKNIKMFKNKCWEDEETDYDPSAGSDVGDPCGF